MEIQNNQTTGTDKIQPKIDQSGDNRDKPGFARDKPGVAGDKAKFVFDVNNYKKRWFENVDRRFISIYFTTLVFNAIIVLYLSQLPIQNSAEHMRKFQEHYANFVYDKKPEPLEPETPRTSDFVDEKKGEEDKQDETKDVTETQETEDQPDESSVADNTPPESSAESRRTAHTKSTEEIAQEVSNIGLLGLLTGSGSAAQGEAIDDVLSDFGGGSSGNLDEVLSGISGIKTSGTPGGSGLGNGARGGMSTGSGTGIDDMIDGLTSAKFQKFGNKTAKMVVSDSKIEVEAGKSAGREPESVMSVVNSHRSAIEYCYQRALRKNPNLRGKISVRFVISASGSVKDVKVIASTLNDPSVEKCIISKIKSWRDFGPIESTKGDAVFRQDYIFGY